MDSDIEKLRNELPDEMLEKITGGYDQEIYKRLGYHWTENPWGLGTPFAYWLDANARKAEDYMSGIVSAEKNGDIAGAKTEAHEYIDWLRSFGTKSCISYADTLAARYTEWGLY